MTCIKKEVADKTQPLSISFFLPPRDITSLEQVKEGDFLKFVVDDGGENFTLGAFYITKGVDYLDLALNLDVKNDNGKQEWRDLEDFELVSADEISSYSCFEHNGQKNAVTDTSGTIRLVETKEINDLTQVHIGDMLMCNDMLCHFTLGRMYTVSAIDYQSSGLNLRLIDDDGTDNWVELDAFERVMLCDDVAPDELKNTEEQPMSTESTDSDEPLMLTVHVSAKDAKDTGLSTMFNIPFESRRDAINACCDMMQYINENMMDGK